MPCIVTNRNSMLFDCRRLIHHILSKPLQEQIQSVDNKYVYMCNNIMFLVLQTPVLTCCENLQVSVTKANKHSNKYQNNLHTLYHMKIRSHISTFYRTTDCNCLVSETDRSALNVIPRINSWAIVFTALHGMQSRSYDENSVRPSVCQMCALWQNVICLDRYTIQKITYPSFLRRRMVGGGDTFYLYFGSNGSRWSEIADSEPIIAHSASAIIPSGKSSINTNRKSPTRFLIILGWSSYVAPKSPKGGSKTQNGRFSSKIAYKIAQRKSATKFIRVKTVSGKVVRHWLA